MRNSEGDNNNEVLDINFFNLNTSNKESLMEHSFPEVKPEAAGDALLGALIAYRETLKRVT